jgi:AraC-like DNA-binding protein
MYSSTYTLNKPLGTTAVRNTGHGEPLPKRYRIVSVPTLVTNVSRGAAIAFSRVRLNWAGRTLALKANNRVICVADNDHVGFRNIPAADAYSFNTNFLPQASYSVSRKGARTAERHFLDEGDSGMMDYNEAFTTTLHSPLDTVRLYVPRTTIQDFVREEFGSSEVHLKPPQQVMRDPILYNIGACLRALFEHPDEDNSLLVDHIALLLQSHLYQTYSATPASSPRARGGLAPWQESRAKEAMEAGLDKEITIARLAHDCRLSASQFARAFRQSTGCTPHRWLLQRRVERAQDLLLTSDKTLAEIASSCGFFDPSHLTRAFGQTVGTSPGLWRRARRT